ncbi:MAG TPA: hypothetical protein VKE50_00885 [Thermoanaerobaculia bacterium]|nr:hypothetical protein [Thermoanaerobaculia bacterium]
MIEAGEAAVPMSCAGVRKMPMPMVWPTTSAVADQKPSERGAERVFV